MIESIGGTSQTMAPMTPRGERPSPEEKFARLDVDGSGSLDQSELQGMVDRMAEKMGADAPSAEDLMAKLDSDGDGAVGFEEFEAGRPKGPPPGPPPGMMPLEAEETTETDLLQTMLDLFKASDEEEAAETYSGVLA